VGGPARGDRPSGRDQAGWALHRGALRSLACLRMGRGAWDGRMGRAHGTGRMGECPSVT
jgi:hypothetical protein